MAAPIKDPSSGAILSTDVSLIEGALNVNGHRITMHDLTRVTANTGRSRDGNEITSAVVFYRPSDFSAHIVREPRALKFAVPKKEKSKFSTFIANAQKIGIPVSNTSFMHETFSANYLQNVK